MLPNENVPPDIDNQKKKNEKSLTHHQIINNNNNNNSPLNLQVDTCNISELNNNSNIQNTNNINTNTNNIQLNNTNPFCIPNLTNITKNFEPIQLLTEQLKNNNLIYQNDQKNEENNNNIIKNIKTNIINKTIKKTSKKNKKSVQTNKNISTPCISSSIFNSSSLQNNIIFSISILKLF